MTVQTLAAVVGSKLGEERAARELRETELRYRQLVELSPDAIAVLRGGVITFANAAAVSPPLSFSSRASSDSMFMTRRGAAASPRR